MSIPNSGNTNRVVEFLLEFVPDVFFRKRKMVPDPFIRIRIVLLISDPAKLSPTASWN